MNLLLEEVANAVNGTWNGPGTLEVRGYSIDTRTIRNGDLFIAIRGPRFDGHEFVGQAIEKGAAALLVQQDTTVPLPKSGVVTVASTAVALQSLARAVRRRWGAPIVGVTGSAGKTTTKEMIATVLARKFNVLRSVGNLNNEFGLPLCLLRAEAAQNIGVLEMGMSARGEIRRLASIAEPNEGVITNVNPVHLEFFKSVDEIALAKAELLEGLVEPRTAYLNNDDPRVRAMARKFDGKIVTYGVRSVASFKAREVQDLGLDGTAFKVAHGRREVRFTLPLPGRHNVSNALAAIAVGVCHEIPWSDIQAAIASVKPEKMRGQIIRYEERVVVVDDSYNSNPKALTEMIRFVGKLHGYSRKIVVAGEMLELGPESAELHRACGREAVRSGAAMVIGVQGMARELVEGALQAGLAPELACFVPDAAEAGRLLSRTLTAGDVVLIKGSRGVKLEQAIQVLGDRFSRLDA